MAATIREAARLHKLSARSASTTKEMAVVLRIEGGFQAQIKAATNASK